MRWTALLGATALSCTATAQKSTSPSSNEPCARVSASIRAQYFSTSVPFVPAADALACLQSVTLDVAEAKALVAELRLYLSWQSSVAYLANPPARFAGAQADVVGALDAIVRGLDAGNYSSEYALQKDVSGALAGAYDFHLAYSPDILGQFLFYRGRPGELALVSLSEDGQAVPKLYNYFDWKTTGQPGSPIVEINGQDADEYLADHARSSVFHDPDARYNRQLVNQAQNAVGDAVAEFTQSLAFDAHDTATTTVRHANGSVFKYTNYALPMTDAVTEKFYDGIADGDAFYGAFCDLPDGFSRRFEQLLSLSQSGLFGRRDSRRASTMIQGPREKLVRKIWEKQTRPHTKAPTNGVSEGDDEMGDNDSISHLPNYPRPVIISSDGIVSGYFLTNDTSVAVLAVPSFDPQTSAAAVEFQDTVQSFLAQARAANKTRLIVDLRGNTGGRIFLGYDLFKQLFPAETPYGATRFRANGAIDAIGRANAQLLEGFTHADAVRDYSTNKYGGRVWLAWSSLFNYRLNLDADGQPFRSWDDFWGPHAFNGDEFMSLQRYNFSDMFSDDSDIDVSGYGSRATALGAQAFPGEDVLLLQDGGCGSTCAIFSEMAKSQGRVRQVVVGGAPAQAPMQPVAGSKGAQVVSFSYIYLEAYQAYHALGGPDAELNNTELGALVRALRPLRRSAWSLDGASTLSNVNLRDNIRAGDQGQTPLEFVYEAADCRLFYTAEMLADVRGLWGAAARARWGDKAGCVPGSTGDPSSLDGGGGGEDVGVDGGGSGGEGEESMAGRGGVSRGGVVVGVVGVMVAMVV